jgi:dissimilatory sulfite reductase (desulfoviridin) alpha/beta subunit
VGSEFCRFGLGDSTTLGIRLEERYKGLESPAKLKLAVAGCPRDCLEAMVKDVGFVAVGGALGDVRRRAAGAHVRKGDLLCTLDTEPRSPGARTAAARWPPVCSATGEWCVRCPTAATACAAGRPTRETRASRSFPARVGADGTIVVTLGEPPAPDEVRPRRAHIS